MQWLWSLDMWRYQGFDYLGMVLSFASLWCLGRRRRSGFLFGAMANGAWLCFGFRAESAATVYANVLFGSMSLWAWWRWRREEQRARAALTGSGR